MKEVEKPITIEKDDSFKTILSKYGALALDKQENLSELIGDVEGELDIENAILSFGDITFPVQFIGFYSQDLNQWCWAWDNKEIFQEKSLKVSNDMKLIGEKYNINEFTLPVLNSDYNDCHTLAMVTVSIEDFDAYYAVSMDGIDIFVAIESDQIIQNNEVKKFRDTYLTFQKNFNIYPRLAFEAYTKLKGYIFKPHDDFALAKIGESRVLVGFTERGNVTRILMFGEDEQ